VPLVLVGFVDRTYESNGITASLTASASTDGKTLVEIPPIGKVIADTHSSPMDIQLSVKEIDFVALSALIGADASSTDEFIERLTEDSRSAAIELALIMAVASAIMGIILGRVIGGRKHPGMWAIGALTGSAVSVSMIAAIMLTYNVNAFQQPVYSGNLQVAPVLVGAVQDRWDSIEDLQNEVQRIASNVNQFFAAVEGIDPITTGKNLRVLHISDIHNNPLAYDLVERISEGFMVDMIVDTGDITDYGTALEADVLGRLERLDTPYYYVPGNHDSPAVIDALRQIEGVFLLTGDVEVEGVRFLGVSDPASDMPLIAAEDPKKKSEAARTITSILLNNPPDVFAAHDPDLALEGAGLVPIILTGHSHKQRIDEVDGSWILDAGTTGGAGIRSFEVEEGVPLTLQLLYIDLETSRLVAVDSLSIKGTDQEFTLQRQTVE